MPQDQLQPAPQAWTKLQVGDVFAGRYEILEHVGTGGTSSVFKVRDSLANEIIALKVIRPGMAQNQRLIANFRRELSLARSLAHTNVLRIFDLGDSGGLLYIVMEYVEGRTLAEVASAHGRFSVGDFIPIFGQFCDALHCVHSHGLIHRDIKPTNLILSNTGVLKLMDFGIARQIGGKPTVGPPVGTPAYMSPEHIMGQVLTQSADIYSAGAMFFELLSGTRPFTDGALSDRCSNPPPSLRSRAPDVPDELARIIEKCLQPEPSRRFQTVSELAAAVAAIRNRLPQGSRIALPARPVARQIPDRPEQPDAGRPQGPGRPLGDYMAAAPPPLDRAVPFMRRLIRSVAQIHSAGGFHQNLTPRTILVNDRGQFLIEAVPKPTETHTLALAERKYCSPEMFHGQFQQDPQQLISSDVYILGFLCYEFLLGQDLFRRQFAAVLNDAADLAWLKWHTDLAQRATPLKELLSECPDALSDTVESMMQKQRDKRTASLELAAKQLQEIENRLHDTQDLPQSGGQREHAAQPQAEEKPQRVGKLIGFALLGVALAVGIALGGIALWNWKLEALVTSVLNPGQPAPAPKQTPQPPPKPAPVKQDKTPVDLPRTVQTPTGTMMLVPAGDFLSGEAPARSIQLPAFYIDRTEVANGEYKRFCRETGRPMPPAPGWDRDYFGDDKQPIINVTAEDARTFAKWAGKRLPTEAEWEKAARGIDGRIYPWGNTLEQRWANLNSPVDGQDHTAVVGTFLFDLSPYGVLDMLGNVAEWVLDGQQRGVLRGGDYRVAPQQASLIRRASDGAVAGFRCAMDPK